MEIRNINNAPISGPANLEKSQEAESREREDEQPSLQRALDQAVQGFDHVINAVMGTPKPGGSTNVERVNNSLDGKDKDLQNDDKMSNFDIQSLLSDRTEAQTTISNLEKKADDSGKGVVKNL